MKVEVKIPINKKALAVGEKKELTIRNHPIFNRSGGLVILELPSGESITVCNRKLREAVERCVDIC